MKQKSLAMSRTQLGRNLLKLIALFFSGFLWFYVLNSEPQIITKKIPVNFEAPIGRAISNIIPTHVTVRLRGPRVFMRKLFSNNQKILFDLARYKGKKKILFKPEPSDIQVPLGIEVLDITPSELEIKFEKEITKFVPIKVAFKGQLPSDLKLMSYNSKPKKVKIKGPIEVMRKVGLVETLPIELSSLSNAGTLKTALTELDGRIQIENRLGIEVDYEIKAKKANFTLKRIPIRFLSTSRRFFSKIKYVSLDVLAPDGQKIRQSDVEVIADIPEGKKGQKKIKLRANLPNGVHLLAIHPESIAVNLK